MNSPYMSMVGALAELEPDARVSELTGDEIAKLVAAVMTAAAASSDFLSHLRIVNGARLAAWEGAQKTDGLFHATELGGEVGEVLNVVKKLHREALGWRGSRASVDQLAEEIGDVLICLDKLAAHYGVNLAAATIAKFNATSEKVGLPQKLGAILAEDRLRPNLFWCDEDPEYGYIDPWEIVENGDAGVPYAVREGMTIGVRYYVDFGVSDDADEPVRGVFDTLAEANAFVRGRRDAV